MLYKSEENPAMQSQETLQQEHPFLDGPARTKRGIDAIAC